MIQDGGADVRPSIVSKLNILVSDSSVIGSYICRVPFDAKLIEYKPDTISSTTPTTSSSTVSPSTTAATTTATTTVPTGELHNVLTCTRCVEFIQDVGVLLLEGWFSTHMRF